MSRIVFALIPILLSAAACDEDPTGQNVGPAVDCSAEFTAVEATVQTGSSVVFDWSPRCRVALLGVEAEDGDRWWIGVEDANHIEPPVTYGVAPEGVGDEAAIPLVEGETYTLILWVATPSGAYIATVHEFER